MKAVMKAVHKIWKLSIYWFHSYFYWEKYKCHTGEFAWVAQTWQNSYARNLSSDFFQTKKTLCQNSSRERNLCARIFPDIETHMSDKIWIKKQIPELYQIKILFHCSSGKYNLIQQIFSSMPPFVRDLLKNFPDYKKFPCSNATALQGFFWLWVVGGIGTKAIPSILL